MKKYYKKDRIEALSKKEAGKFIESLKNVLKHERTRRDTEEEEGAGA